MKNIVDMTKGNALKHILKFAIPLLVVNIGQQLYTVVDAIIVGRGVGVDALAAVGSTDWIYWFIAWSLIAFASGLSIFVARYFGAKDYEKMNKVIATAITLSVILGLFFTIVGVLIIGQLLKLLNTPSNIYWQAKIYLITMTLGSLIVITNALFSGIIRAFGNGKASLVSMIMSFIINVGLDLIFVLVFRWGVVGAAIASLIAQLVSTIYYLIVISKIDIIKLDRSCWKIDWRLTGEMIRFATPIALQMSIIACGGIFLQGAVNLQGGNFIAGYSATNKVYGLIETGASAFGVASTTYFSQNYGAKLFDKVKLGVRTSVKIMVISSFTVFVLMSLFGGLILQLFIDINEAGGYEAIEYAKRYLRIMCLFLTIRYVNNVYRSILESMGISFWSMMSGVLECASRIIMAKIFVFHIGTDALFISEPLAWLCALLILALPYYFYYRKRLLASENL